MSKALSIVNSDYKPTPLQQAAIKRIQEFDRELKRNGYHVCTGMELEFMVVDKYNHLAPISVSLKQLNAHLKGIPGLERFQGVKNESTAEYEFTVGDAIAAPGQRANAKDFNPLDVAATTHGLRHRHIAKALRSETCYSVYAKKDRAPFHPVFHAYPYSLTNHYPNQSIDATCAMHINASLFDAKGNNLFTADPVLAKECADSLVRVQHLAAHALLPKNNSYSRLKTRHAHASVPSGLGTEKVTDSRSASSVMLRGSVHELPETHQLYNPNDTRIENRLPGADADPFVAMAITLAGLVQAVRDRNEGLCRPEKTYPLPESRSQARETLAASRNIQALLGKELVSHLLDEGKARA